MLVSIVFIFLISISSSSELKDVSINPYIKWENGPLRDPNFFTIAVWLQDPSNAFKYKQAGINTYIGLWKGPTEKQLSDLKKYEMKVLCYQNEVGLRHIDDSTIIGWMQQDEPDNAQSLGEGKGYGPPILPENIINDYKKMQNADSTRPVFLNLGQGVAWDGWFGRGVRTNHPEDYPEYIKGCDIVSFDIYPVTSLRAEVTGNLWFVARGVERLREWSDGKKIVWNCIECTRINNPKIKPSPKQVRAEVWMSIVHGSMGIIYFVHEWQPIFKESALLSDPEMLSAVTEINRQITELAPILNTPTLMDAVSISSKNEDDPVAVMMKKFNSQIFLFTVGMRDNPASVSFTINDLKGRNKVTVLGEDRTFISENGVFKDNFNAWDVHLYRIKDER